MNETELLEIVCYIGKKLTQYGAEIYRVEESVNRICAAYGYHSAEVYAIPSNMVVTVYKKDRSPLTQSVRINTRITNLDRVGEYNRLCRRICREKPDFAKVKKEIDKIESRPVYGTGIQLASYLLVGFSFVYFFGGEFKAALIGAAAAGIIFILTFIMTKHDLSAFLINVTCSAAAALFAIGMYKLKLIESYDTVVISALMTMVPGVSITNGMRDFISGDLMAGIYTIAEAFTTAVAMAVGAGSVIALFR